MSQISNFTFYVQCCMQSVAYNDIHDCFCGENDGQNQAMVKTLNVHDVPVLFLQVQKLAIVSNSLNFKYSHRL